jgi:cobalt-zinc-cadmium efflux system membrane fusion protein
MKVKKTHIGLGIGAVVVLAGILRLSAGSLAGKMLGSPSRPQEACTDHGCGEEVAAHGREMGHADGHGPDEGNDRGAEARDNLDPGEIEKRVCEHKVRTIDCDECRYELGVVKVDPSVTGALTKTTAVQEGASARTLRLTGEVQYDQTTVVDVLPAAGGRVVSVKARLGRPVRKGDVLAVVHSGDFGEAKAAYLEAFASAEVAAQEKQRQLAVSASLERLLAASSDEHADGLPGEVLGEWKSRLANAVARLKQAKVVLEREKSLVAKQASSRAELETAEREMQTAQADYTALLEEIQLNITLDRLRAESASRLADAKLIAAEQRLHLFGLDDEAIKAIPQIKDNGAFAQLEVKAPRSGVITVQNVTEGRFVENSQALYTIADTSNVWVWCDLYERDLGPLHDRLARGDKLPANVKVTAFADIFPGAVDLLDSAINETTRTVKVRVQAANEHGRLRPGMFAAVEIPLTDGTRVALVPRQAVLSDEGRTFAFVHWKDDLWLRRDVIIGRPQDEMVEVLSGLSAGDQVVASGGFLFKSDILRAKMGAGCAD